MNKNVLLVVAILLAALGSTQAASAQLCNAEAHSWVAAHRSELPKTFEELSRLPLNVRRAVYGALEPESRSQLWQRQLELALQSEDLTEAQRDVVLEAMQLATSDTFAALLQRQGPRQRQVLLQIAGLEKRAREAFGNKAAELFGRIGPADMDFVVVGRRDAQASTPGIQESSALASTPLCSCSTDSDWCDHAAHCASGGCTLVRDECGTFWAYDCNGLCQLNATTLILDIPR
jgi:hypothetical protein